MKNLQLTSELVRAARALLRWEQRHLSEASSVSLATIKRLEAKAGSLGAHPATLAALRGAFENAGIEFTNGDKPGVRLSKSK
jgi:transcriptional regulator with XRE-family HTH domain